LKCALEAQGAVYSSGVSKVTTEKKPKRAAKPKVAVRRSKSEVLEDLLGKVEKKLAGTGGVKASVTDYIRLMQLQRELKDEDVKDIEVRWIDREPESGE
jgi:hypothetical protein